MYENIGGENIFGATSQYKNNLDFKVIDFNDFADNQTIERYEGTEAGIISNRDIFKSLPWKMNKLGLRLIKKA